MVLELKNIEYEYQSIQLYKDGGEQKKEDYKEVNPMQQVRAACSHSVMK